MILISMLLFPHPERRSGQKLQPVVPVPLDHLDPQTPELSQLVSQWQKLWLLAVSRQSRLEQHQQMLKEVIVLQNVTIWQHKLSCLESPLDSSPLILWRSIKMYCFMFAQMEEFANFDFNIWRKRYIQWISHLKSRILDVFRSIDRDQDGRISQKEFVDYVLASSKNNPSQPHHYFLNFRAPRTSLYKFKD